MDAVAKARLQPVVAQPLECASPLALSPARPAARPKRQAAHRALLEIEMQRLLDEMDEATDRAWESGYKPQPISPEEFIRLHLDGV